MPGARKTKRGLAPLLADVCVGFSRHDALSLAAAVAFYTALSFAPLVLLLVNVGGVLGEGAKNELVRIFQEELGGSAGEVTRSVVETARAAAEKEGSVSAWRWVVSSLLLMITASGVFAQLQASLNRVWEVEAAPVKKAKQGRVHAVWTWLRKRLLSMGMVLVLLFILLVSLVVSTIIESAVGAGGADARTLLARALTFSASLGVAALLFAAMFKLLPDVKLPWRNVWTGALLTAALFSVGRLGVSLYLEKGGVGSRYGAAIGGLIALLVWVYYSCIIVLLGAEITRAWAGGSSAAPPAPHARRKAAPTAH